MLISVFDFEATDADVKTARVTEMAVAVYDTDSGKIVESFSQSIYDPSYPPMNEVASAITGVTDEFLKKHGMNSIEAWKKFMVYINKGEYIMGHNVRRFDIPLAQEELRRFGMNAEFKDVIDTRFDPIYPAHIETRKLPYLAFELGIVVPNAHAAMADVNTTYALFAKTNMAETIERSKSPEVYIKAHVDYDNKDKAKAEKYFWDGNTKSWMKCIKLCDVDKEKGDFRKEVIVGYKPPN